MALRKKKILVIDDSRDFLAYITVHLKKMGFFKINLAEGGQEALKLMKIWHPDVIVLDFVMPEMDGLETLDRIRASRSSSKTPVIIVLPSKNPQRERICTKRGADRVITKPVSLVRLNAAVQDCFAIAGMNRRKNLRAPFNSPVRLKHKGQEEKLRAAMLSEGGIFLMTNAPLPVGERSSLEFKTAGSSHSLDGKVIYHARNYEGGPKGDGMALKFMKTKTATVKEIRGYVEGIIGGKKKTPPGR